MARKIRFFKDQMSKAGVLPKDSLENGTHIIDLDDVEVLFYSTPHLTCFSFSMPCFFDFFLLISSSLESSKLNLLRSMPIMTSYSVPIMNSSSTNWSLRRYTCFLLFQIIYAFENVMLCFSCCMLSFRLASSFLLLIQVLRLNRERQIHSKWEKIYWRLLYCRKYDCCTSSPVYLFFNSLLFNP